MEIAELANSSVAELREHAETLNIPYYATLRKPELVFRIHQGLAPADAVPTIEGVLDIRPEGYGFLRSGQWQYQYGPDDVYVSPAHIRRFSLRKGDTLAGRVRPPRRAERYLALASVERVNGDCAEGLGDRATFDSLRPGYPEGRLTLESPGGSVAMRIMDLIAPVGMGQRGLIVSPPKAGKTTILREMAQAISVNHPRVELVVLLIDERPEEVTEMEELVAGDVLASTFDEPPRRHRQVAEMALAKAKRQVEHGRDVVILLDSITRLARAYNTLARHSGRILSGGLDAKVLQHPKRFFGSARNITDGGSLTIVATALVDTGSRMDQVIFEEFKGTGNMELVLDRRIADQRVFPAIDLNLSGTRREELLLSKTERNRTFLLRNFVADMPPADAVEFLAQRLSRHDTNAEFLDAMAAGE